MKNTQWKSILMIILALIFFPLLPLSLAAFLSYKIFKTDIPKRWLIISGIILLSFFALPSWVELFKPNNNKIEVIKETTPQEVITVEQDKVKVEDIKPEEIKAPVIIEETKTEPVSESKPIIEDQPVTINVVSNEKTQTQVEPESVKEEKVESKETPVIKQSTASYDCNCKKTCAQMSSCREAQYQLNTCGCSARDADHDGIACDSDCQ